MPEVVSEALEIICSLEDELSRSTALIELAEYMPAGKMTKALALARSIHDEFSRCFALIVLA